MNVNLGAPYETAIQEIISKGYAGTQTEAIRQAILAYRRVLEEEEEMRLLGKAIEFEKKQFKASNAKLIPLEKIKEKYKK